VSLTLLLRVAGAGLLLLALLHLAFPRRFHWDEELQRLSLLNRQMFRVHVLFICVVLVFFGCLSLFLAEALQQPGPLARGVLLGFTGFWGLRLFVQLFVYDSSLWRADRFNTAVHVLFTAWWAYLTAVYAAALLRAW
jgi:FtsH-binding integral membrane protein